MKIDDKYVFGIFFFFTFIYITENLMLNSTS